jgi:prepilin-type N-terminal cleavage/methylation domain-containing protein
MQGLKRLARKRNDMNALPDKTTSRTFKTRTGMAFGLRQAGFSLVEIAVVLAILGLALGAGITILNARLTQGKIDTTKARVEGVRQALVAYVAQNYRLPCPAGPGLKQGDVGFNAEEGNVGGCTATNAVVVNVGAAAPAGLSRGTVPCVTLGISEEACYDAYGTRLTYFVDNSSTRLTKDTVSGISGSITLHKVDPPALFTLNAANQISQGSAIVISHGANRGGGYAPGSIAPHLPAAAGISIYEIANTDNDVQFVQNSYVEKGVNSFDDVVVALVPRDLVKTLSQANVIKDPRVLMDERFDFARQTLLQYAYTTATFVANAALTTTLIITPPPAETPPTGGPWPVPYNFTGRGVSFTSCITPTGILSLTTSTLVLGLDSPQVRNDAWGSPMRYQVVQPSVPQSGSCTIPALLISAGPDGVLNTPDDLLSPISKTYINAFVQKSGGWKTN